MQKENNDTENREKGVVSSNNGINVPFNGYNYDPYFSDNLEPILKELQELRKISNVNNSRFTAFIAKEKEIDEPLIGLQNKTQFNGIQLIYSYFVWIVSLATVLVSADTESYINSNKLSLNSLQTISNILLLNTIKLFNKTKTILSVFVESHKEDPSIINTYLSFIGLSVKFKLFFLLIMNSITSSFSSFLFGFIIMAGSAVIVFLSIPVILLVIIVMLFMGFSITVLSSLYNQLTDTVNTIFPTRDILTYFANQIPPSVGRVEVSQRKQLEDYNDKLKEENNQK